MVFLLPPPLARSFLLCHFLHLFFIIFHLLLSFSPFFLSFLIPLKLFYQLFLLISFLFLLLFIFFSPLLIIFIQLFSNPIFLVFLSQHVLLPFSFLLKCAFCQHLLFLSPINQHIIQLFHFH